MVLACPSAWAQTAKLYRCGNTFSQAPCGADATEKKMIGAGQGGQARDPMVGARACVIEAQKRRLLPQSARVAGVERGEATVVTYAGQPMVGQALRVSVTLAGASPDDSMALRMACVMSEDEQRVLRVQAP
jgi:hypothetical protein